MTRRQLVLHLLREAGERGVTTSEFLQGGGGSRFGGRILELREQGHVIEVERIRDGAFRYTLTRDAGRDAGTPHARPASGLAITPPVGVSPGIARPPALFEIPAAPSYRDIDEAA